MEDLYKILPFRLELSQKYRVETPENNQSGRLPHNTDIQFMKKLPLLYCAIIICILFIALNGCSSTTRGKKPPKAVKGLIDLSNCNFEKDGPVKLDGEWEFYWNKLLTPADFIAVGNVNVEYIDVPSIWNSSRGHAKTLPGTGFATYRLTVVLSDINQVYAVKMKEIFSAYKLWVDGKLIYSSGKTGKSKSTAIPKHQPHVTHFNIDKNEFDIVIQVSNFSYKDGGIRDAVEFGLGPALMEAREKSLIANYALFGSFLIMAIYHFALYGLRREDNSTVFFGLFCLLMASRILATDEAYIVKFLPNISWEASLKTIVLGYYLALPVFITFMYKLYPQEYHRPIIRIIQIVGAASSLMVLVTPAIIYTKTELAYQIFLLISSIYAIGGLIRAVVRKRDGAIWVIGGILVLFCTVINDVLYAQHVEFFQKYQNLLPVGLFIFIFSQSYILSARFSNAFKIANIDELSQVFNRRRFMELAEQEFLKSERTGSPLCLLSIDADHFKSVNDNYGHDVGDLVLKTLAGAFKENIRKPDIFGRMGGEEFALLLPETNLDRALQIADRLRRLIEATQIPIKEDKLNITVSIGVAATDTLEATTMEALFKNSDTALYQAKNNGRNQVAAWSAVFPVR